MRTLKTDFIYGLIVLLPIAILGLVAYYLYQFWTLIFQPISDYLELSTWELQLLAAVLVIPAFLLLCVVLGALVRTGPGEKLYAVFENNVLSRVPGYGILAKLFRGFSDDEQGYPAALVDIRGDGALAPAFIMEDVGGPQLTVFVPFAPVITAGRVYVVDRDRVRVLENSTVGVANDLSQWGIGLQRRMKAGSNGRSQTEAEPRGSMHHGARQYS